MKANAKPLRTSRVIDDLTKHLAAIATVAILLTVLNVSAAEPPSDLKPADLRAGSALHVKSNSIWFTTSVELSVWQGFGQKFAPKDVETYQNLILEKRMAWQFTNEMPVAVVSYDPTEHQVEVKMLSKGRFYNTTWWIDDKDCTK
jgi:hypothetical protein